MFDAQILIYDGTNASVYSPWFPRGGDHAKFFFEVVALTGSTTLTMEIVTKNSEDPGNGTPTGASAGQASVGIKEVDASLKDLEEMVRYKFTIAGASGVWVMFRVLSPVWYDATKA